MLNRCISLFHFFKATYPDAAKACKMYIDDSNYETDKQLGRGFRKKRKPDHLDSSESSDKEFQSKVDLNDKRNKMIKKSNSYNTQKKTSKKCKTSIKAPPSVPLPEKRRLSPETITRQHIPQLSKQPSFLLSVAKDSGKDRTNFLQKTLQKGQEKENFAKKGNNSRKESSSSISTRAIEQDEISNCFTPSENLVTNKGEQILSTDTQVVSSVSNEMYTPTNLSTLSRQVSISSCISSQSTGHSSSHEEYSYIPSVLKNIQSTSTVNKLVSKDKEVHLEVTGKLHIFCIFALIVK